jgi:hypothetical protein
MVLIATLWQRLRLSDVRMSMTLLLMCDAAIKDRNGSDPPPPPLFYLASAILWLLRSLLFIIIKVVTSHNY